MAISGVNINRSDLAPEIGRTERELEEFLDLMRRAQAPECRTVELVEGGEIKRIQVQRLGVGPLRTPWGLFWQFEFSVNDDWRRYQMLSKSTLDFQTLLPVFDASREIIVRPDSGCVTGQRFSDETCDCKDQLGKTMQIIADHGQGVIVHIPEQDGRGMGIPFKLATLWVQDQLRLNTVAAASLLSQNGIIDVRTYGGVVAVLKFMGIQPGVRVALAVNNPDKAKIFAENGYAIERFVAVAVAPTPLTLQHMRAKAYLLGHIGLLSAN